MNFSEVINGLKNGKKFRRMDWEEGCYIQESAPRWSIHLFYKDDYRPTRLWFTQDFEANDWVEVKE